jgi:hypothetical protein
MGQPRYRIRTLMIAVVGLALGAWGAMMGNRSYNHYQRASLFGTYERGWRQIAARDRGDRGLSTWGSEAADYYGQLAKKYRRAMWRPWTPVTPDPPPPEFHAPRRRRQ